MVPKIIRAGYWISRHMTFGWKVTPISRNKLLYHWGSQAHPASLPGGLSCLRIHLVNRTFPSTSGDKYRYFRSKSKRSLLTKLVRIFNEKGKHIYRAVTGSYLWHKSYRWNWFRQGTPPYRNAFGFDFPWQLIFDIAINGIFSICWGRRIIWFCLMSSHCQQYKLRSLE